MDASFLSSSDSFFSSTELKRHCFLLGVAFMTSVNRIGIAYFRFLLIHVFKVRKWRYFLYERANRSIGARDSPSENSIEI